MQSLATCVRGCLNAPAAASGAVNLIQTRAWPSVLFTNTSPLVVQVVAMSMIRNPDAQLLWSSMTGVSPQGKKRGRARNQMKPKNLNRGQILGIGSKKIGFPGLTKNLVSTQDGPVKQKISEIDEATYTRYEENLNRIRETGGQRRKRKEQSALERGWTGSKSTGRKFGPPQATNQELSFPNFDSILLEFKTVCHMTGNMGRVRRTSALMVAGNKNGTFGYSLTSGKYGSNQKTMKTAVNKAGLRLINIERFEDRTVFHDFFTQYNSTRIFVEQRPPGYGIKAQRGIKAICEMAGIKDLYAKIEGSTNIQCITKAFILGLLRQKSHQTMADEHGLHLVQMRPENDYFPVVLASPSNGKVRTQEEIGHNEILDFRLISYEGHVPNPRPPRKSPWEGSPQWDKHLRCKWAYDSHEKVRQRMWVENGFQQGAIRSHLYEKYPECIEFDFVKARKARQEGNSD